MKTALTIAGSDCSGGAGIQADIKTMTMNGVYASSAVTALTAQNTTGVMAVTAVSPELLTAQIDAVFEDIRPDAVKIGMIPNAPLAEVIVSRLSFYKSENVVIDPVAAASSGSALSSPEGYRVLKEKLLPLAQLVTPNIPEAELLSGMSINNSSDMEAAAKLIAESCGCDVLIKGGHSTGSADDLLYCKDGSIQRFSAPRIDNPNTHGTGCTLSSAIAANLAKGYSLPQAAERAKEYITAALNSMLDLGRGSGPLDHMFDLNSKFAD